MEQLTREHVRSTLISHARSRQVTTYGDFLGLFGIRPDQAAMSRLFQRLNDIADECERQGEPSLAVLVVNKKTGIPGTGFFNRMHTLGKADHVLSGDSARQFAENEAAHCFAHWDEGQADSLVSGILQSVSAKDLENLLRGWGYEACIEQAPLQNTDRILTMIRSKGASVEFLCWLDDEHPDRIGAFRQLILWSKFETASPMLALWELNEWNRTEQMTTASYISGEDSGETIFFHRDITLRGGIAVQNIRENLEIWNESLERFCNLIRKHGGTTDRE